MLLEAEIIDSVFYVCHRDYIYIYVSIICLRFIKKQTGKHTIMVEMRIIQVRISILDQFLVPRKGTGGCFVIVSVDQKGIGGSCHLAMRRLRK